MYANEPIKKYLDDLAARLPAPGGGSSAALAAAMASALISMVLNFTIGNEKYKGFESTARELLEKSENLRQKFTKLFEEDIKSYDAVRKAYKMPKDNKENKKRRKQEIQKALRQALLIPLEVCTDSVEAVKMCLVLARDANPNMICDVEVPLRLLEAAFYSAKINVVMNQKGIDDPAFNKDVAKQLNILGKELLRYKEISEKEIIKIIG